MGWWSSTIMGGDPPMDREVAFEKVAGVSCLRDELLTKELVNLHLNGFIERIKKDKFDPEIGWLVLGVIIMRTGATMPENVRKQLLKNAIDTNIEGWTEPEERKAYLEDFKEKVTNYKNGEITEVVSEGLMEKIYKTLGGEA